MAQLAQHEAAELWELARDHMIACAKIQWMSRQVQDPQLRSMLEQHARRFQQAGQQIEGFITQGGHGSQTMHGTQGSFTQFQQFQGNQFQGSHTFGQSTGMSQGSFQQGGFQTITQNFDLLAAGECLKECKHFAIACIWGATESSQPARNFLYQLAGEHLHMAEQHYRWLDQRNIYASPKTNPQDISEYNQKLRQISQAGQQVAQQVQQFQFAGQAQGFGGTQHQYATQQGSQQGSQQWGTYQQHQPSYQHTYSGAGNFSSEQMRQ